MKFQETQDIDPRLIAAEFIDATLFHNVTTKCPLVARNLKQSYYLNNFDTTGRAYDASKKRLNLYYVY